MIRPDGRFSGQLRLKRRVDFLLARQGGTRLKTRHFLIYIHRRQEGPTRLGITASRKIGGAVQRNRVKRLVREFFRLHRNNLQAGMDYSIIARNRAAATLAYSQVCLELQVLMVAGAKA